MFCQHDGVVMMMMFYRRRASPKHRYDMIEVDYGGEGHHTRLRDQEINCCVFGVPPAPVYKGARGEVRPAREEARQEESYSHRERRKEKGAAPLVQFGPEGGCAPPSFRPLSSIPVWPMRPSNTCQASRNTFRSCWP